MRIERPDLKAVETFENRFFLKGNGYFCETDKTYEIRDKLTGKLLRRIRKSAVLYTSHHYPFVRG
jgi:hypothetical protein